MPNKHKGLSEKLSAPRLFALNVAHLLHLRHQSQKDLAQWCHKSEVWISLILRHERQARMEDFDRIADFFGLATYQLFQPGISPSSERRSGRDRRAGQDRRISHAVRVMLKVGEEIERVRPKGRFPAGRKIEEAG